MFTCKQCSSSFQTYQSLRCHEGALGHGVKNGCNFCDQVCSSTSALNRHRQKFHAAEKVQGQQNRSAVKCGECARRDQTTFVPSVKKLCEHLKENHTFDVQIENFSFQNRNAFENWRKEIEGANHFSFVSHRGKKKKEESVKEYFYCYRTGFFDDSKSNDKMKAPKAVTSNRVNYHCCCFATVVTSTTRNEIQVSACLQHYGHDDLLIRLRIPRDVHLKVAQYLREDRNTDWILTKLREDMELNEYGAISVSRENLIRRQDIINVANRMGLRVAQKSSNDMQSVHEWVQNNHRSGDNELFCYSPQDDQGNFCLGIQTGFQREMLKIFGQTTVCVDSTHGTNKYGFLLVTLLVVDEFGKGFPTAWFLTKCEDENALTKFFLALKERVGDLTPKIFMSDDAPAYYNAWSSVFNINLTRKLLCSWHVAKNWTSNTCSKVKSKPNITAINHHLFILIREKDETNFRQMLDAFLVVLSSSEPDFEHYFRKMYCDETRIVQWAAWARKFSTVNTNMYLERFHGKLKHKYLERKQNHRLDYLIHILFRLARDDLHSYTVDSHSVSVPCYRLTQLHARHRKSKLIKPEQVRVVDGGWEFTSYTYPDTTYFVSRIDDGVCRNTCKIYCRLCKAKTPLCPHLYDCTCQDTIIQSSVCKHVHYIHSVYNNCSVSKQTELEQFPVQYAVDPKSFLEKEAIGRKVKPINEMKQQLDTILQKIIDKPITSNDIALQCLQKAQEMEALLHFDENETRCIVRKPERKYAPNKINEPQRRFLSVKRGTKRKSNAISKPTKEDTKNVKLLLAKVASCVKIRKY